MKRRESLDQLDAERVGDFTDSPGWQLIRRRIESVGLSKVQELKRDLDPAETAKCRGFIAALELVLDIPRILREEGTKNGDTERSGSQ